MLRTWWRAVTNSARSALAFAPSRITNTPPITRPTTGDTDCHLGQHSALHLPLRRVLYTAKPEAVPDPPWRTAVRPGIGQKHPQIGRDTNNTPQIMAEHSQLWKSSPLCIPSKHGRRSGTSKTSGSTGTSCKGGCRSHHQCACPGAARNSSTRLALSFQSPPDEMAAALPHPAGLPVSAVHLHHRIGRENAPVWIVFVIKGEVAPIVSWS